MSAVRTVDWCTYDFVLARLEDERLPGNAASRTLTGWEAVVFELEDDAPSDEGRKNEG